MEEDILKYSPTVMFRGTPCICRTYWFGFVTSLLLVLTLNPMSQELYSKKRFNLKCQISRKLTLNWHEDLEVYIVYMILAMQRPELLCVAKMVQQQKIGHQEFIRIVCTLCTLVYHVIGCSINFKFKQSTLKLQLSNKLIIVGAKNCGKLTTQL